MATQKKYSQEFKNDAVEYRKSHAELSLKTCAANLGVSPVSLREWIKATDDTGKVVMRGLPEIMQVMSKRRSIDLNENCVILRMRWKY